MYKMVYIRQSENMLDHYYAIKVLVGRGQQEILLSCDISDTVLGNNLHLLS